ncbi:MAG TPA: hypothetical protein VJU78_14330, partial [Chitinophagaceae bacterium]|nr:hypothetical protein [Chitinophagaceae bacterium]
KGKAKIWLATTNQYKTGGKDVYTLIKTVPVRKGRAVINVNDKPSKIYKIVIDAPHNSLNRWIFVP